MPKREKASQRMFSWACLMQQALQGLARILHISSERVGEGAGLKQTSQQLFNHIINKGQKYGGEDITHFDLCDV